jgi:hypothetical protein
MTNNCAVRKADSGDLVLLTHGGDFFHLRLIDSALLQLFQTSRSIPADWIEPCPLKCIIHYDRFLQIKDSRAEIQDEEFLCRPTKESLLKDSPQTQFCTE